MPKISSFTVIVLFCTPITVLTPAFAGDYLPPVVSPFGANRLRGTPPKPPVPASSGPYISPILYQLSESLDLTRKTSQQTYLQMLNGFTPQELYPSFAAIASLPPPQPKLYAQALARSLQQFPNPKILSNLHLLSDPHSFSPQHPQAILAIQVLSFLP